MRSIGIYESSRKRILGTSIPGPTENLQMLLQFEDNTTDLKGNVSITGSPASYPSGKVNKAAAFNGSSTDLYATTNIINNKSFSVSYWVYPQTSFQPYALCAKGGSGSYLWTGPYASNHWYVYYYIEGGGAQQIVYYDDGDSIADKWWHFVFTHSTAGGELFINTTSRGTFSDSLNSNFGYLKMGRRPDYDNYFTGYLDQVRIYDKVLSGTEIGQLYNSGSGV